MKHRLVIAIELLLLFTIIVAFLLAVPSIARSQNDPLNSSITDIGSIYKQALSSPFTRAAGEIKDPKIADFFNELVFSMGLDKSTPTSDDQASSLANLIPDISKIQKTAMTAPLIAAGREIRDQEIADFYRGFLKQCGVTQ